MSHLGVLVCSPRMGLVIVGGGRVDENGVEERTGDTSSYEMRARSHKLRKLIVPRMSVEQCFCPSPLYYKPLFPF